MEKCKLNYYIILAISVLLVFSVSRSAASDAESFRYALTVPVAEELLPCPDIPLAPPDTTPGKKGKTNPKNGRKSSKKVTFETFEENYQKAMEYYDRQLFISAATIFEQLYPLSLGTPRADTILYLFADCYYNNRDYEMAAFHFKEYANKYSANPRAEDAYYKAIMAIANISPEYSLDQTETLYAIEEIQVFIRKYPNSRYMDECNSLLDKMREKLARKAFEIFKLYYYTENYKSAQISAESFFKEYSYSQYADDAYLILVKNNYEYASHSVESKKVERYNACIEAFQNMKINHPYSPLLREAEKWANDAQAKIDKKESKNQKRKGKENED